jgi:hypothetical protein
LLILRALHPPHGEGAWALELALRWRLGLETLHAVHLSNARLNGRQVRSVEASANENIWSKWS